MSPRMAMKLARRAQPKGKDGRASGGYSALEEAFWLQLKAAKLPLPERQAKFHPERRFTADFYWQKFRVIVECDGAVFAGGRHNRGLGYIADRERDAEALMLGIITLRVCAQHIKSGQALAWTEKLLVTK